MKSMFKRMQEVNAEIIKVKVAEFFNSYSVNEQRYNKICNVVMLSAICVNQIEIISDVVNNDKTYVQAYKDSWTTNVGSNVALGTFLGLFPLLCSLEKEEF